MARYHRPGPSRKKPQTRNGGLSLRLMLIGIIAFALVLIVMLFMFLDNQTKTAFDDSDGSGVSEEVIEGDEDIDSAADSDPVNTQNIEAQATGFEEITLTPEASQFGGYSAVARRGAEGEQFKLVIVADLPGIDSASHSYEVWLVQPGITDFFSVGSLFAREDGRYGFIWESSLLEAESDLFTFSTIIITREINDGNLDPSPTHALRGEF